jgi:SAM-dependent methyltransferase
MTGYILDQTWNREAERLAALEGSCDPLTVEHLGRVGVARGWHCLEVGAGRGSIAHWLADRVGDDGRVVAVDLDVTLLEGHRRPNLEVRRLDVLHDPLPEAAFDLVHARHVIGHLRDRQRALGRLVSSLRPGGCLLVEDFDFCWTQDWPCDQPEHSGLLCRSWMATLDVMRDGSYDGHWGRRLPGELRAQGLSEIAGEARAVIGDRSFARMWRLTMGRFRERIIQSGALTAEEVDRCDTLLGDMSTSVISSALVISAWGFRPRA